MSDEKSIDEECLDYDGQNYSELTYTSFSLGYFVRSFLFTVFSARVFAFYETEIFLAPTLILIAYVIYGGWNMINDPLMGYISDRPNRFWNKWGRRFPWIVGMGLPYCFLIILVFAPPNIDARSNPFPIFIWLIFSICLYDTVYSGWMTNYYALFPDKFRSNKERRKIAAIGSPIGLISTALGTLLPPIFISYGTRESYITAMIIMSIISFIVFLGSLPGSKEGEELIECANEFAKEEQKQDSFFQALKYTFQQKNFLAYLIAYLAFHILITITMASIPYINKFLLNQPASSEIILSAAILIGQLTGIPLWILLTKKVGHKGLFLIGLFWAVFAFIILFFMQELITIFIGIAILGFGVSSIYMGNQLVFSDCIDEIVIDSKKRQEGVFLGIRTFFIRLSIIAQALTFVLIHIFTGFDPQVDNQTPIALLGLRIQFAIVPMIIMFLAGVIFWKLYDLTPEKVERNKNVLEELNL